VEKEETTTTPEALSNFPGYFHHPHVQRMGRYLPHLAETYPFPFFKTEGVYCRKDQVDDSGWEMIPESGMP